MHVCVVYADSQSVSQLFHGPAPRSPLHRLSVRFLAAKLRCVVPSSALTMPSDRGDQLRMLSDRFAARQTGCRALMPRAIKV